MDTLRPGQFIGPTHEILEVIDTAGTTAVYRCRHFLRSGEQVVKVLSSDLCRVPAVREAFFAMAAASQRVTHAALIPMERLQLAGDHPALVLASLRGESLAERVARLPAPWTAPVALAVLAPVLEALVEVHAAGLVHGGVGPRSVFLQRADGAWVRPALLDLGVGGLWHALAAAGEPGTPQAEACRAPELRGASAAVPPHPAQDVFAAASLAWTLLSGGPPPLAAAGPLTLPGAGAELAPLAPLLAAALQPDPGSRPSMAELYTQLAATLAAVGGAPTEDPTAAPAGEPAPESPSQASPAVASPSQASPSLASPSLAWPTGVVEAAPAPVAEGSASVTPAIDGALPEWPTVAAVAGATELDLAGEPAPQAAVDADPEPPPTASRPTPRGSAPPPALPMSDESGGKGCGCALVAVLVGLGLVVIGLLGAAVWLVGQDLQGISDSDGAAGAVSADREDVGPASSATPVRFPGRDEGGDVPSTASRQPGDTNQESGSGGDANEEQDDAFPAPPPLPATADMEAYDLHRQVQARASEVDSCYRTALGEDPELRGLLDLELSVDGKGKTGGVRVRLRPSRSRGLERCVKRAVRKWRFERSGGGSKELSVPFVYGLRDVPEGL